MTGGKKLDAARTEDREGWPRYGTSGYKMKYPKCHKCGGTLSVDDHELRSGHWYHATCESV